MSSSAHIDLVLPCYNPSKGWDDIVLERLALLRARFPGKTIRLIMVNDGSEYQKTAGSMARLEREVENMLLLQYPHNMGKGFALRTGIQRSLAPTIVFTDIDFPYTIESMVDVINPVVNGEADVALAIRNQTYYEKLPRFRRWMSRLLRKANESLLGLKANDTQGGLKAMSGELRETFLKTKINRYLFDLEFIYLVSRRDDLRVLSVESDLRPGIIMSPMRFGIVIGESLNFLKVLLRRR